jgi:outer membrane protein OmpA-like peptidoglycan-associated protein
MKPFIYLLLFAQLTVTAQTDTIKIYFDIGAFEASTPELLKLNVDKSDWQKVDVISYTDYLGSERFNKQLSINRSREIRSRLVQYGLNTTILGVVKGEGITGQKLKTPAGIKENRRTDILITKKSANRRVEVEETKKVLTEDIKPIKKVELKSQIESASVGDQLVLKNMVFLPGQHFLTESSLTSYDELFETLKQNPELKIKIEGHICCKIDDEDGLDLATNLFNLSEARAKYIYDILIKDGISAKRLSYEGFARDKPLYPEEKTEEEKAANRRVEIRIIEK